MKKIKTILVVLFFLVIRATVSQAAITSLNFTGKGYISQNQSWEISAETGYIITPNMGWYEDTSGNELSFTFFTPGSNPHWFELAFQAVNDDRLEPGMYLGVGRYPYVYLDAPQPTMYLSGDGRGSNQVSGWFQVIEIDWLPSGFVQKAAIDFYLLSEGNPDSWTFGSLRYNSDTPINPASVPEPGTTISLLGLLALTLTRKR